MYINYRNLKQSEKRTNSRNFTKFLHTFKKYFVLYLFLLTQLFQKCGIQTLNYARLPIRGSTPTNRNWKESNVYSYKQNQGFIVLLSIFFRISLP